ncbi:metallophosphoesterase [Winogradskyella sp.]
MKKRILRYLKHISLTILIFGASINSFGLYHGASMHYGDNPMMMDWDKDGPYAFIKNDSTTVVNYIRGNQDNGFYLDIKEYPAGATIKASTYFPLDSTTFEFNLKTDFKRPPSVYNDNKKVLAISDIESGFKTFRDFLMANNVIDKNLNWIFGSGHLVLNGDFVDRGFSTTQVLWFIYKLEQDAKKHGGIVHFILGNHELKNMQGNFDSTSPKYFHISSILEKKQTELYDNNSILGKWMSSKNTIELINGTLFTHGGIHPEIVNYDVNLNQINKITSERYYTPYYPKVEKTEKEFLNSTYTGVSWYRGYYKEDLSQEDIDLILQKFQANAIAVGHTLQSEVNRTFNGKVIGIDVKHPKDYHKNFPSGESEGLLVVNKNYYRLLSDGTRVEI